MQYQSALRVGGVANGVIRVPLEFGVNLVVCFDE